MIRSLAVTPRLRVKSENARKEMTPAILAMPEVVHVMA
jgi:hypothetical protein